MALLGITKSAPRRRTLDQAEFRESETPFPDGYVDLHQVSTLTFSSKLDAKRKSDLVGGIWQLQCSNCGEFGTPETATCVNESQCVEAQIFRLFQEYFRE